MTRIWITAWTLAAAMCGTSAAPGRADESRLTGAAACAPYGELHLVCGAERPEDLAHIPGTRWLIVSGFQNGAGLKLVDSASDKLRLWYTADSEQIRPDHRSYAHCPSPPDPGTFNVQGISLRETKNGSLTLLATNHGSRESIEIFNIDTHRDEPRLTWIGCIILPTSVAANSVASFSDGTILITELTRAGTTITDFVNLKNTGAVYEWKPDAANFIRLKGTELPGNNGLETARDDSEFYVVAFGWHAIVSFARNDTSKPKHIAVAPGFMPDNIHWDRGRLIAGGMQFDEPSCGGVRKIIDGNADGMLCHRGYVIAEFLPKAATYNVIAYAGPDAAFNGVSGAVLIGNELWISSYQAHCVAHRTLAWLSPSSN